MFVFGSLCNLNFDYTTVGLSNISPQPEARLGGGVVVYSVMSNFYFVILIGE